LSSIILQHDEEAQHRFVPNSREPKFGEPIVLVSVQK